jgi:hypothetical protein
MRHSIIEKLEHLVQNPIDTECKAVYLMTQLRKLWEEEGKPQTELALWMHWALHTELSGQDTISHLLLEIDAVVDGLNNGLPPFSDKLSLASLKDLLKHRLTNLGLPTLICDQEDYWTKFITSYSGIIEDGTLKVKASAGLNYVTEVIFKKGVQTPTGDFPFSFTWKVKVKDCRFRTVNITPNSHEHSHGFTVWSYQTEA